MWRWIENFVLPLLPVCGIYICHTIISWIAQKKFGTQLKKGKSEEVTILVNDDENVGRFKVQTRDNPAGMSPPKF